MSAGTKLMNCEDVKITNTKIIGFDNGIEATNSKKLMSAILM
jgi:hypothetical protein